MYLIRAFGCLAAGVGAELAAAGTIVLVAGIGAVLPGRDVPLLALSQVSHSLLLLGAECCVCILKVSIVDIASSEVLP